MDSRRCIDHIKSYVAMCNWQEQNNHSNRYNHEAVRRFTNPETVIPQAKKTVIAINEFLKQPKNVLTVINNLPPENISTFIYHYMRPIEKSEPYKALQGILESEKPSDEAIICDALVQPAPINVNYKLLYRAVKNKESELNEHLRYSLKQLLDALRVCKTRPPICHQSNRTGSFVSRSFNTSETPHTSSRLPSRHHFLNLAFLDFTDLRFNFNELTYANLEFVNFPKKLKEATLTGSNMAYAKLDNANAEAATFSYSNLSNVSAENTCFDNANFEQALMMGICADKSTFKQAKLKYVHLDSASIKNADFTHSRLDYSILNATNAHAAIFTNASMRHTNISRSVFTNTNFENAKMRYCDINSSDFSNANLNHANLRGSLIENTNFKDARLIHADITGTRFVNCNLAGIEFFSKDHIQHAATQLLTELNWWHTQIKDHPNRRELRRYILSDLLAKSHHLSQHQKTVLYDITSEHALFSSKQNSFGQRVNTLFSTENQSRIVIPSKCQRALKAILLPQQEQTQIRMQR